MTLRASQKGMTLVELMIVVAIIGILAAMAIPHFMGVQVRSRRAEAYLGLGQMNNGQVAFFSEAGYFTPSIRQLGISMGGKPNPSNGNCVEGAGMACGRFYAFWVPFVSQNTFLLEANGWPDTATGPDTFVIFYP